jgi:PBP1b-binding outer membrane lipoprotein LpoB
MKTSKIFAAFSCLALFVAGCNDPAAKKADAEKKAVDANAKAEKAGVDAEAKAEKADINTEEKVEKAQGK